MSISWNITPGLFLALGYPSGGGGRGSFSQGSNPTTTNHNHYNLNIQQHSSHSVEVILFQNYTLDFKLEAKFRCLMMLCKFVQAMCLTNSAVICRGHQKMHFTRLAKMIMCKGKWIILSVADCITAKPVYGFKENGSLVIYSVGRRSGEKCLEERGNSPAKPTKRKTKMALLS